MTLDRTIERTALTLTGAYGRCRECGHVQRDPTAACEEGCEGQTVEFVEGRGIPEPRARLKAEGTIVGKLAAVAGTLLMFVAGVVALIVAGKGNDLTIVVGLIVGILGILGFGLFAVGMTLISRDVSPAIGTLGELLVRLVRAARGRNGG